MANIIIDIINEKGGEESLINNRVCSVASWKRKCRSLHGENIRKRSLWPAFAQNMGGDDLWREMIMIYNEMKYIVSEKVTQSKKLYVVLMKTSIVMTYRQYNYWSGWKLFWPKCQCVCGSWKYNWNYYYWKHEKYSNLLLLLISLDIVWSNCVNEKYREILSVLNIIISIVMINVKILLKYWQPMQSRQ